MPAYNESRNIGQTCASIAKNIPSIFNDYEIIVVDDGSEDQTIQIVKKLKKHNKHIKLLVLSRNFGKEVATSAGIAQATGHVTLIIDADGQHPPEYIPEFVKKWQDGAQVVVGIRKTNSKEGPVKKYGSRLFYFLLNKFAGVHMVPASTDFRLIDQEVREAFAKLQEGNRIMRGLIDWMGYDVDYVNFHAKARVHGEAAYNTKKLVKLAMNSVVSLSLLPLYISGYIGVAITGLSMVGGVFVIIENYLFNDPLGLNITGSASLGLLITFLVGIVLIGQGLTAVYISRIYEETKGRPLFIVNKAKSILG